MAKYRKYATGTAALTLQIAPDKEFQFEELRLHLSAAGAAGSLTATLDSGGTGTASSTYDTVLLTRAMAAITDLDWQPTRPLLFAKGDIINIVWTNTAATTWGAEAIWS
jgi:hypothetical protein